MCPAGAADGAASMRKTLSIMKKGVILSLLLTSVLVCGCDFFRTLAGRPTSGEIEEKRAAVERLERAKEQARLDSVRVAEKAAADSLSAVALVDSLGVKMLPLSGLGGAEGGMASAYVIVVGSFRNVGNAEGMAARVSEAGYAASVMKFESGMFSVVVKPCSRLADAVASYVKVKSEKFCPEDAWILCNE